MDTFKGLVKYSQTDIEKRALISDSFKSSIASEEFSELYDAEMDMAPKLMAMPQKDILKVCPQCREKYPSSEIICPECLIRLKRLDEFNPVKELDLFPKFEFSGKSSCSDFTDLLSERNFKKLEESTFSMISLNRIIKGIKKTAFLRLNDAIKQENLDIDNMKILDVVLLFVKSFVSVAYKSQGLELGYFEFNRIYIDDRQSDSDQIITMLHELSHFLVKEIMTQTLCKILDISKNEYAEAFITHVLSNSGLSRLVDEYAAHTVEARFTVFGYQDYSSFLNMEHDLADEDVQVAKMIGNNFAIVIKDILESFLDDELRESIRSQFLDDVTIAPDFSQLRHESCQFLKNAGFVQAILLMLTEGFKTADDEILKRYLAEFTQE